MSSKASCCLCVCGWARGFPQHAPSGKRLRITVLSLVSSFYENEYYSYSFTTFLEPVHSSKVLRFVFISYSDLGILSNKKPYGFIDGPFIPQDTQSKKSEYIESAWECGCYLWILLSRFLNVFLFACSRLLLTRDTLCTGFWTQNNPPLITKNNILIVNTFFQSFMLNVINVYSILITDK